MSGGEEIRDKTVIEFRRHIQTALGDRLKELWLFGSRARGDHRPESDYDFLIVAEGERAELREMVAEKENEIMLRSGEILASVVYTPSLWNQARNAPLGLVVRSEGKRIA